MALEVDRDPEGTARDEPVTRLLMGVLSDLDHRIRGLMRFMGLPGDESEDMLHEVIVVAWEKRQEFRGRSPREMLVWTTAIARRVVANRARLGAHRRVSVLDDEARVVAPGGGPIRELERSEVRRLVRRAIERLPADDRMLVEEVYFERLSYREIAENRGVSKSWVCRRLRAIYGWLRKHGGLEGLAGTGGGGDRRPGGSVVRLFAPLARAALAS